MNSNRYFLARMWLEQAQNMRQRGYRLEGLRYLRFAGDRRRTEMGHIPETATHFTEPRRQKRLRLQPIKATQQTLFER